MWLFYALTTAVFYAGLDFFIKKASGKIDDFLGSVLINFFSVLPALVVYIWLRLSNQQVLVTKDGTIYSMLAGLSIGIGSITFIKMFSLGTNVSLGSPVVRITTIILTVLIGMFVLRENATPRQIIGLVLALAGLGLLIFK